MIGRLRFLFLFAAAITESTASATQDAEGCEEIFVGAGWAGVYSFYRRIVDDPTRGPKACLFEESWRVGGRTYSVHTNHTIADFVVDIGAYRFSPDMHLPGDLILHDLNLDTECYADDCPNPKEDLFGSSDYGAPLRRIVDPETRLPAGYVTPLLKMIDIAKSLGGRVFVQTPLVKLTLEDDDDTFSLEFEQTSKHAPIVIRSPSVLVLNLPRSKLFEIQGVEDSLEPDMVKTLQCITTDFLSAFTDDQRDRMAERNFPTNLEKAYLYYSDAWWRTVLNKPEGFWPAEFPGVPSKDDKGLLFNIRFHDGPVSCGLDKCSGWLEIYYDGSNETIYSSAATNPGDPLGSLWGTDGPSAVSKLKHIHTGLIDILKPLFLEMSIDDPHSIVDPPSGLLVGVWHMPNPNSDSPLGSGYTAPTKVIYDPTISGFPDKACGVPGLTDMTFRDRVLQPWGTSFRGASVFLVNNDWVCTRVDKWDGDWAEESLLQAERAMLLLGTRKPRWLDELYYRKEVESKVSWESVSEGGGSGRITGKHPGPYYWEWLPFILFGLVVAFAVSYYPRKIFKRNNYTSI